MFLIRYGEIGLKGKNRSYFEKKLVSNIKEMLKPYEGVTVERNTGRIIVHNEKDDEKIGEALSRVFGISGVCPVTICDKKIEEIEKAAFQIFEKLLKDGPKTFKVEASRADKTFPMSSREINVHLGDFLLNAFSDLKVDVHHPDILLHVEIREEAYLYSAEIKGMGGLPLGTSGKGVLLLSGGIDSPVAGYMAMRRGLHVYPVYFHSPPFTSEKAKQKVIDLVKTLGKYNPVFQLRVVYFTDVQKKIIEHCPENMTTIIMRRMMMRIAEKFAEELEGKALVTGENLGQVASQTIDALGVTNASVHLPVLRPLIAFDKVDIIQIAKKIETFETSILPYEDCCTIFVPKKPKTRPKLLDAVKAEEGIDWDSLINEAIEKTEVIDIVTRA